MKQRTILVLNRKFDHWCFNKLLLLNTLLPSDVSEAGYLLTLADWSFCIEVFWCFMRSRFK